MYVDGESVDIIPDGNYKLLDSSYCTYKDGSVIDNLTLNYDSTTKSFSITPYTIKGTKCALFFEEYVPTVSDTLLANYSTQLTRTDFSTMVTNTTTGTIYYADTSKGRTYYFAGNPTDNWVKFAEFYWRIIRINEDGSLRLIYQGTSGNTAGTNTQIQTSYFNPTYTDNMYVGFMYTSGQVHGTGTDSTIKDVLDGWYTSNLSSYASKIDGNAGFCGDRSPYSRSLSNGSFIYTSGGGIGTTSTYYGGFVRLDNSKNPTFECANSSDLYTTSGSIQGNKALTNPIGLISMDEVRYAGGYRANNTSYYLYTGQDYFTMSPSSFDGGLYSNRLDNKYGVRPVINLKSDVTISSGNGTSNNPYVISLDTDSFR